MNLPIEISPNPLVTSTVEIRFSIKIEESKLFSLIYPLFASELPSFEENAIPKQLKENNEQLRFTPDYILKNEDFSLSFSNKAMSFENVSEYKLWKTYFEFIKIQLEKFFSLNIVENITRIGVRYASVFDGITGLDDVLKFVPKIPVDGYTQLFNLMRLDLKLKNYNFHLQMANNAKAIKKDKSLSGPYVDIDASLTDDIKPNSDIFRIIDDLHLEGKSLFFNKLIKPSFLQTLNPKY